MILIYDYVEDDDAYHLQIANVFFMCMLYNLAYQNTC